MTELNTARIRYDRTSLIAVLSLGTSLSEQDITKIADTYEAMRVNGKDKPCQSKVWHGPGHQSSTFCGMRGGETGHDISNGRNFDGIPAGVTVHYAILPNGGEAEWTDADPYDRGY